MARGVTRSRSNARDGRQTGERTGIETNPGNVVPDLQPVNELPNRLEQGGPSRRRAPLRDVTNEHANPPLPNEPYPPLPPNTNQSRQVTPQPVAMMEIQPADNELQDKMIFTMSQIVTMYKSTSTMVLLHLPKVLS